MPKTYAEAGVDIERENASILALVKQLVHRREGVGRPIEMEGFFTALIDFGEFALSLSTDGVGTKIVVAEALGVWNTIGIDCVAMNVNDMICVGAEPLAFVDYFAVSRYDEAIAREVGEGLNRGAEMANVTIIGGEFATIPEIVRSFDLAGTCLGVVEKDRIITGRAVSPGDAIMGLPSTGIHSNGLTLARKVFQEAGLSYEDPLTGGRETVGEALLRPTAVYVKPVLGLVDTVEVHGLANITGGGFLNLPRMNPKAAYCIEELPEPQPIFAAIQEEGGISSEEMYRTFNMGMGFCVVVPEDSADDVLEGVRGSRLVGHVEEGSGVHLRDLGLILES
jgi:phosphoribosylformylglycinamidine cyclo-ligase